MSTINCEACESLRTIAPDFVTNGVTDAVCESLANDTGLNPKHANKDAPDLHLANDCMIGQMGTEINAYDICDWKEFMERYIGNHYEVDKGIICALGGLWELLHKLIDAMGGGNGRIPVMRRYRVNVPKSAFGQVWRLTQGAEQTSDNDPGDVPSYHSVTNVTEWFAGSGNNVDVGEFWVKVPVSEMDTITGVWTQSWVVPRGNSFDGRGKPYIQTVNVQEWYEQGNYLHVNFDTYELCPNRITSGDTITQNGGPYPVTIDFLIVGTKKIL